MEWFAKGLLLEKNTDVYGRIQRGKCLMLMKRFAEAKADFLEAVERKPS